MDPASIQTPLFFRFNHLPFLPAIVDAIGGTETVAAVALAIVESDRPVSYSRNRNYYAKMPLRYRDGLWSYSNIVSAVDFLDARRLIFHDRVPPGNIGWQSSMTPTPKLKERIREIVGDEGKLILIRPTETIVLRDAYKNLQAYSDNAATRRMRREIEPLNEALRTIDLGTRNSDQLVRIFNKDFCRGGRFYCRAGGWQCLSPAERGRLKIGGENVVELDYKSFHPSLLYCELGLTPPVDCYEIPGWNRDLAKCAVLILINALDEGTAIGALARDDAMACVALPGTRDAFFAARRLFADIKRVHKPISGSFHSDAGARLMRIDSDVAANVMAAMYEGGRVVLPIHDSFICQASQVEHLHIAMLESLERKGFTNIGIATAT